MHPLIVSLARYLIAAAILATIAFGATNVWSLATYGLLWPNALRYVAYALAVAVVGVVVQHIFTRLGWVPAGAAPPRHGAIDLALAVLVLGMMTAVFVVAMR